MTTVWIHLKESLLLHNWIPAVLLWKKMVKRSIGSLCTVSQSKQSDICLVCPIVEELCIENANDKYLVYLTWTQRSSPKPSSAATLVCKYSLNNELYPFKITSKTRNERFIYVPLRFAFPHTVNKGLIWQFLFEFMRKACGNLRGEPMKTNIKR